MTFLWAIITQALPFLPLAFGISISYNVLNATDMTIDGSFVIGAAVFAKLVTAGSDPMIASIAAIGAGALAGTLSALIQRGGRIDPLLAGVLATFILTSLNLVIMGKPNISLLTEHTLLSNAFAQSDAAGYGLLSLYVALCCGIGFAIMKSRIGLRLRAFGDNPTLLKRLGFRLEFYRVCGFALSNALAAAAGCLTSQTVGYADIGMGFGMTLTGIGAIILGRQIFCRFAKKHFLRIGSEFVSCVIGVLVYFFALNALIRLEVDPIYLKMILGVLLVIFLRAAVNRPITGKPS